MCCCKKELSSKSRLDRTQCARSSYCTGVHPNVAIGSDEYETLDDCATPGTVSEKHGATVANVAARFIMQQPAVAAIIVGARLGESSHIAENCGMFDFQLDADDVSKISAAVSALSPVPGDCGDEYRKPPFLTATGDLSDHLETLPQVFSFCAVAKVMFLVLRLTGLH